MLEKLNTYLILLTNTTEGSDGLLKYNLFTWFTQDSQITAKDGILITARVMYNLLFIVGGIFMGYKLAKSIYVYNSHDVTSLNKKQMAHEFLEPIVGMFLLAVGWIAIRILANSFLGIDIGAN